MRGKLLMAGFALVVVLPSAASAQETCEERASHRMEGAAVGAVAGALLGAGVAGHHEQAAGAVVGGLAGAVVGDELAQGPPDCRHAYGWYDDGGRWHASAVAAGEAYGYYDRDGEWVQGQPVDYHPAPPASPPPPQRVDWDDRSDAGDGRDWPGYPQFRGEEAHISDQIREGAREEMIAPNDARDLMGALREVRAEEYQEFQAYGWRLPSDDGARIRQRLAQLDHQVVDIRDEP